MFIEATAIGVPAFGYLYEYTWLDWMMFVILTSLRDWALPSATID